MTDGSRWDVLRHSRCECLRRLVSCSLLEKQFRVKYCVRGTKSGLFINRRDPTTAFEQMKAEMIMRYMMS